MTEPGSNKIDIWYHCLEERPTDLQLHKWLKLLSEDERARYNRFYFDKDKLHFLAAHALLRLAISEYLPVYPADCCFETNAWGKPSVLNPEGKGRIAFNLSHTQGLVACGIAFTEALGLDVEWIDRRNKWGDIARHTFAPTERAFLEATQPEQQRDVFFRLWTLKEAYTKARGQGLSIPLDSFGFKLQNNSTPDIYFMPEHGDSTQEWNFFEYQPTPRHRMALAIQKRQFVAWKVDLQPAQRLMTS